MAATNLATVCVCCGAAAAVLVDRSSGSGPPHPVLPAPVVDALLLIGLKPVLVHRVGPPASVATTLRLVCGLRVPRTIILKKYAYHTREYFRKIDARKNPQFIFITTYKPCPLVLSPPPCAHNLSEAGFFVTPVWSEGEDQKSKGRAFSSSFGFFTKFKN